MLCTLMPSLRRKPPDGTRVPRHSIFGCGIDGRALRRDAALDKHRRCPPSASRLEAPSDIISAFTAPARFKP